MTDNVTPIRLKGPWVVICPDCGGTKFHLYEDPNYIICADEDCAEVMGMFWVEEEGVA